MSGYGFKSGDGRSLPIVITRENCISRGRFIKNIEFRKTDKAEYLTIEVKDKEGFTARRSYFEPKIGTYVKDQAALDKEMQKFNRTMENLTKTLLSSKYETGAVSSFSEFCNKVISDIGKAYVGKELRIKLVYNSKNEASLPNWPTMFEDPTIISDANTKMKVTDYDKVEPSEVKMDEDKKDDVKKDISLDDLGETNKKGGLDDLPF